MPALACLAFTFYGLSLLLSLAYLHFREERLAVWKYRLLGVGVACQFAGFILLTNAYWSIPENRYYFPVMTFYGALCWLALVNAAVLFIVEGVARLRILGAFVLPWSCLAGGVALFVVPEVKPLAKALQSFRMNLHPMLLMLSYSAFATAFGVGLALLIQERQIKSRRPNELCYRLPPIEDLDKLHYRIIAMIFPILTLGLLMSGAWGHAEWKNRWWTDAKVIATVITWLIYLVFLYMRYRGRLRGRKSVYLSMAGFIWIVLSFVGANYISAQHGYLYGR